MNGAPDAAVRSAQSHIYNALCVAYMRTKDSSLVRAEKLRKELAISERLFLEALEQFKSGDPSAVEVVEVNGEAYLRLGEASRDNCDFEPKKRE